MGVRGCLCYSDGSLRVQAAFGSAAHQHLAGVVAGRGRPALHRPALDFVTITL